MLTIDFTSYRIKMYEKQKGSIYNLIALDTDHISELLKVGTGCDSDEEVCNFLDALKKSEAVKKTGEKGLKGVLWYLIDLLDEEGFFTYLTAQEIKSLIQEKLDRMNKIEKMTEEERKVETEKVVTQALQKLIEAQKKINAGTESGKNLK